MRRLLLTPPSNPVDLTKFSGLHVWWNGRTISAADGARLSRWDDQSGNLRHALQATSGKQPAFALAAVNGKPGVRFANSRADALQTALFTAVPEPATIALAATLPTVTPGASQNIFEGDASTRRHDIFESTARAIGLVGGSVGPQSAAQTNGSAVIIVAIFNGASSLIRVNGVQVAATTGTAQSPTAWTIGSRYDQTSSFDGFLAEVAAFSVQLAAADIVALERMLGAYYGITVP